MKAVRVVFPGLVRESGSNERAASRRPTIESVLGGSTKLRTNGLCARFAAVALGLVIQLALALPASGVCTGDCDGDGRVAVNELIAGVNVALGQLPMESCEAIDRDGDGRAGIDDLVHAVEDAVGECDQAATATPTSVPVSTPTETATQTPTRDLPTPTPTITLVTSSPTPSPSSTPSRTHSSTPTVTPTGSRTISPTLVPTAAGRFRDVALSTQAAMRVAVDSIQHLAFLHDVGLLADGSGAQACPAGGRVDRTCEPSGANARDRNTYHACRSLAESGNVVERNGTLIRALASCESPRAVSPGNARLQLDGFRLEERHGDDVLLSLEAHLSVEIAANGKQGCAGADADERFDGTINLRCAAGAESISCPARGVDTTLRSSALVQKRVTVGLPCRQLITVHGELVVQDRSTEEQYTQLFEDLTVSVLEDELEPGKGRVVSVDGEMRVDCLETMRLTTARPLRIPGGASCPIDGELVLGRSYRSRSASVGASAREVRGITSKPPGTAGSGFRQFLFRALNGRVYQVIQNDDTANNADAIQLTTLVGSLGDSVATCTNTVGGGTNPIAVAIVSEGSAFALEDAVRSALISDSALPCFNRNAQEGGGRVCIGVACTGDCSCPDGAQCVAFTFDGGTPLAEGEPAAMLMHVNAACGNFASREAYAFGPTEPTTERALCAASPPDGFRLPLGSTLIVAYDTLPLEFFNAGAAGFPIDLNGDSSLCPQGPGVLSPGRAASDTAAAPRIEFGAEQTASADFDGDGSSDQLFPGCESAAPIECAEPDDPTPTPTVDPSRPCGATVLDNAGPIDQQGSTAGRPNTAGEAGCGWGGGSRGPDQVFEYVAAAAGIYDIEVEAAGFAPYLYIRTESCLPERPELRCEDDAQGTGKARVTLDLVQGQRIAIVVDGADSKGGPFRLLGRRRQPDLIVVPGTVTLDRSVLSAGDEVGVAATIANRGDGDTGPFEVHFFLANDPGGTDVVSIAPVRCSVSGGLAAGQAASCTPNNALNVPLIAEGAYFLVASADGSGEVAESDEGNNARSIALTLGPAQGGILEQQVFRANDGTVYQLIEVVPQDRSPGGPGTHRITTLAGSLGAVETCASGQGTQQGTPLTAVAGSKDTLSLSLIRRTDILRPNNFGAPRFDPHGSGKLLLGAAAGTIEICNDPNLCVLHALSRDAGGIPPACVARLAAGSYCQTEKVPEVIAFGLPHSGDLCNDATQVSVMTQTCFGAGPLRGFDLKPGEVVVFVYKPGREAFAVGAGGFALAADESNSLGCAARQIISGEVSQRRQERRPLLGFVETQSETAPLAVAVSPDGRHAYLLSPSTLLAVGRDTSSGALELVGMERNGVGGVDGLDGAVSLALSPDGRHVYVAASSGNTVAVFARDAQSGGIDFVELERDGVGGVNGLEGARSVAVSPDGQHVYVASYGDNAVAVFARDAESGGLDFVEMAREGVGGAQGLRGPTSVTVSPDGRQVYVAAALAGSSRDTVAVFARDVESGGLEFVEVERNGVGGVDGVDGAVSVALSPDGRHLYVASFVAVAVFARDVESGELEFVEVKRNGVGGVEGLLGAESVTVSPDGRHVYVAAYSDDALAVFSRDAESGELEFVEAERGGAGADGLGGAQSVTVSPDGRHVYVASFFENAVVVFSRATQSGAVDFVKAERDEVGIVDGLFGSESVAVSPDGRHVYVAAYFDSSVAVFARDAESGRLNFTEVEHDRVDGVDGLHAPRSVTVSPDGRNVYVAGSYIFPFVASVAVFGRDETDGGLEFVEVERDLMGDPERSHEARSVVMSPDGRHVYVANYYDNAVAVFGRDETSGELDFVEAESDGVGGVDGSAVAFSVAMSPDGRHVYLASDNGAVAVFARDTQSGRLQFVAAERDGVDGVDGLGGASSVAVSPDGRQVYVAASIDNAVVVFARDVDTGGLGFVEMERDGVGGVDGLLAARSVTVSPDGRRVYVGSFEGAVALFARDAQSGGLEFVEVARDGVDVNGLGSVGSIAVSPDGENVYATGFNFETGGSVVVFSLSE